MESNKNNKRQTKIIIMGREQARRYSEGSHDESSAIISISTPGLSYRNDPAPVKGEESGVRAVLYLSFPDTDKENYGITEADAKDIASFADKYYGEVDILIVHCDAGISRSAGVGAAIMKAKTGNDFEIFANRFHHPNSLCYKKVLAAFNKEVCYVPSPVDTSGAFLPWSLEDRLDILAGNLHEIRNKVLEEEGYSYGSEWDGSAKKAPCMTGYLDLSEDEQAALLCMAEETVKLLIKLGYEIRHAAPARQEDLPPENEKSLIFRAKDKDSGAWKSGYYVCVGEGALASHRLYTGKAGGFWGKSLEYIEIDPKSLELV